jgi:HB1, ASXL, restriction endonuclease HTH domain
MRSKKKTPTTPATNPQAIKIGSRVRCTEDAVQGRIVWANAVAVKIRWDDGEQVTWRRDSLAERPVEILAESADEDPSISPVAADALTPTDPSESAQPDPEPTPTMLAPAAAESAAAEALAQPAAPEPAPVEPSVEKPATEATEVPVVLAREPLPADATHTAEEVSPETAPESATPLEQTAGQPDVLSATTKQPRRSKPTAAPQKKEKQRSALNAAAKVLEETDQALTCPELIAEMAARGYWTSPAGKTPAATLYSALLREISAKGSSSRFVKTERGKFARSGAL